MMSPRFAGTIRRAALMGVVAAVVAASLVGGETALARPRSAALFQPMETERPAEHAAPTQRDQLFPSQQRGGVSLAQATSMAQSRYQGRVVRAETVQVGDRLVHEIRILGEDGRVRTVRIDAQTGSFL
jgi:uncharacterized membrane protein YkoI